MIGLRQRGVTVAHRSWVPALSGAHATVLGCLVSVAGGLAAWEKVRGVHRRLHRRPVTVPLRAKHNLLRVLRQAERRLKLLVAEHRGRHRQHGALIILVKVLWVVAQVDSVVFED